MDAVDKIIHQWKTQGFDADNLNSMESIGRIKRLEMILAKRLSDNFQKNHHLAMWEFDVMATLRRAGEPYCLSPTVLFDSMMISSGAMTNRLQQLERKLLITRVDNSEDKRSRLVRLSEKGLHIINQAAESHIALETELLSGLTHDELTILNVLLKKVEKFLDNLS